MEFALFLFGLIVGAAGGFFLYKYLTRNTADTRMVRLNEENAYLREQIEKLKMNAEYWYSQANATHDIQSKLFQNYNTNATNTISAIVGMLQSLNNSSSNLSNDDMVKIQRIIEQAKGLG